MMLTGLPARADSCFRKGRTMPLGLLGLKVGMTQVYEGEGKVAPVTVLQIGPCPVLQIRNQERDGYDALQLGFQDKARRKATRAERGSIRSNASNRGSGRRKKGIRMAGPYGAERVTVRNLTVVKIDADNHLILVKGAVPGPNGGLVMIRPTNKRG